MNNSPKPVPSQALNGWDGSSRRGQALYDRQFEFEKSVDEIMYIIEFPFEHTEEEVEAAYAALERIK